MRFVNEKLRCIGLMQKEYKLFYGNNCYPLGGWDDFKGYFESELAAREHLEITETESCSMWAHIVFEDKIIRYATGRYSWEKKEKSNWKWRDEE